MRKNKKKIVCICIAGVLIGAACLMSLSLKSADTPVPQEASILSAASAEGRKTDTSDAKKDVQSKPYTSPIDFKTLQSQNHDIYAWLEIPGTKISYPLLQHPTDDSYYLNHRWNGEKDSAGSLFTEHQYNNTKFTDPVTVVYAHDMLDGSMFGRLQEYFSDSDFFSKNGEIIVYMPDQELHFTTFAAVPFDKWHILYNYTFTNRQSFQAFFDYIMSIRAIGANFKKDVSLTPEDRVLILSTCLKGNRNKRYLVCAKLINSK